MSRSVKGGAAVVCRSCQTLWHTCAFYCLHSLACRARARRAQASTHRQPAALPLRQQMEGQAVNATAPNRSFPEKCSLGAISPPRELRCECKCCQLATSRRCRSRKVPAMLPSTMPLSPRCRVRDARSANQGQHRYGSNLVRVQGRIAAVSLEVCPNPSIEGTSTSKLRLLAAAPHVKR
jgi:hypothetical protein